MHKTEIVMVRMTPQERQKLHSMAERLGCPNAAVLRKLLNAAEIEPATLVFHNSGRPDLTPTTTSEIVPCP